MLGRRSRAFLHSKDYMTPDILPFTILPALRALQSMLEQFHPDDVPDEGFPLEFWTIRDDSLFFDALQYLPCCLYVNGGSSGEGHSPADLALLPKGFQIATSIFNLEEQFAFDGWTAIHNLGADQLSQVIEAYSTVGLPVRAEALRRVRELYLAFPDDDEGDRFRVAARGKLADLIDDEAGWAVVRAYLRSDPVTLFGALP